MRDEQADPKGAADPAGVIFSAFQAGLREECSWEEAAQAAASSDLARDATAGGVARLSEAFTQRATQLGASALRLAELVERHADALADLERSALALPLYEAIRPVFEKHAEPRQRGFYHANRAHRLATCGKLPEAVAAYNDALPLLRAHASPDAYALCHVYRANLLRALGELGDALSGYDAALALLRQHGPPDQCALCQMNQALTLLDLGRFDEAALSDNAVSLLREHVPPGEYAGYLAHRANALEAQDKLADAVAAYGEALPLLRQHCSAEEVALCLACRARLLVRQRRFAEAVADYDDALPFFREHGEPGAHGVCLMKRAGALEGQDRLDEALADYDHALRLLRQDGAAADLASCLAARAGVLRRQGKLAEAAADYSAALPLLEQDDSAAPYALCLMDRAGVFEEQGDLEAALADYDEGLPLLREHAMSNTYHWHQMDRVGVLDKLGRLDEAEAAYDDFLAHGEDDNPANLASALVRRAEELLKHGHLVEAVARYNAAAPLLEEEARSAPAPADDGSLVPKRSPQVRYADCLVNRASALRALGQLAEAVASYDAALPFYEKEAERTEEVADHDGRALLNHGPLGDLAQCHMNRASTLKDLGKLEEAVAGYDSALPFLRKLDRLEGEVINGEEDLSARAILQQHARMASAYCLLNRALALVGLGEVAQAVAGFHEALPLLRLKQDLHGYALCLGGRATALQQRGELVEALANYDEALRLLRQHGWPADCARCLMSRAGVLRLQGKLAEALADYDSALPVLRQHGAPTDYAQGLVNRASTLAELGRLSEAVSGFRDARGVLLRARRLGRIDETSVEFTQRWGQLFDASVWAGLAAGDGDQAYQAVCDGKAGLIGDLRHRLPTGATAEPAIVLDARAALTDWMRNHVPPPRRGSHAPDAAREGYPRDLEQFVAERDRRTRSYLSAWGRLHHGYDPERTAFPVEDPVNRSRIQQCLPMDWALLDFWRTGEEEFTAFVLFRDAFHIEKLPFPLGELRPKLDRMVESLYSARQYETSLEVLGDLHHYLFGPLLPLFRPRRTSGLYLVPQDFLHQVPLHAARSAEDGRYLCDEFAIAFLPSAALLPQLPKPDPAGPAFVLANPEFGTEHSLPFAHWEGLELAEQLGLAAGQFYLGKSATLAATEAWAGAGLVHFSCHGSADPAFAPRSHLRLADDLLLAHDVLYRRQPLREGAVVILNGCQTSVPDTRAVNEGLGLMSAFLIRGAGLVLATQWSVDDACAAEMVLQFVEQLRTGGASPAQALKRAQQYVRQLTVSDVVQRDAQVEEALAAGSRELAKVKAHRAWAYLRAGLSEEATRAAEVAIPALRGSAMPALAERLLDDMHSARGLGGLFSQPHLYESPVSWGAFQLVGRVT